MIAKKHWLLLRDIFWAVVIFVLCTIPASQVPSPGWKMPGLDKVVHFGMFFIMAIFLCSEFNFRARMKPFLIVVVTILICALYGGLIEILQERYFERSGDWWDWAADTIGAVAGCVVFFLYRRWRKKQRRR